MTRIVITLDVELMRLRDSMAFWIQVGCLAMEVSRGIVFCHVLDLVGEEPKGGRKKNGMNAEFGACCMVREVSHVSRKRWGLGDAAERKERSYCKRVSCRGIVEENRQKARLASLARVYEIKGELDFNSIYKMTIGSSSE